MHYMPACATAFGPSRVLDEMMRRRSEIRLFESGLAVSILESPA
jgi:hypothetical protein